MARTLGIFFAALLLSLGSLAQAQEAPDVEITEYGIFQSGDIVAEGAPPTLGYRHVLVSGVELLSTTRIIPASLGLSFGIRYRLNEAASSQTGASVVPVRTVIRFPPSGLLAPGQTERLYADETVSYLGPGDEGFFIHSFDHQWEIQPGIWTFEIWVGDTKVGEEQFEVILPPIS